ncbi:hypothetical protein [Butyrivibrio sp. INlla14]|uniref:hypothetical protein n=1 Tax=Butyrivibrio sp. INlla14 TaxID=1520808 RepID=UPI0008761688|nr:hypothetical protein [Butyrivibrio sp. INlla14]SCY48659.1 hypothetical protein SAMN02910371_02473 [Butyrivibrio sp. INlla14]
MDIKVNIKQIGKKKAKVSAMPFSIENQPHTVRELIKECVHTCVSEYNDRVRKSEQYRTLTEEDIQDMSEVGKIAFGINYGGKEADENKALENAIQSYEDGLYRIFIGEEDAGEIESRIVLEKNSEVTFIRLSMLSGRMW